MKLRFTTASFLWAMLLIAVSAGWIIDRTHLSRTVRQLNAYDAARQKQVMKLERGLKFCNQVNEELRADRKRMVDKLMKSGTLKYSDVFPTR